MAAFPGATGIDRRPGADIVADLGDVDYDADPVRTALATADGVVHLATSPEPEGPDDDHYAAVVTTAMLVAACQRQRVPRLVLASSDWAEPKDFTLPMTTYGHSKRVIEALAAMYAHSTGARAVALRIGWVPDRADEVVGADEWLAANYWSDERLISEVRGALGF